MGRRLEQSRKISNDRVRKIRKPKSKILIAVEGKNKTEKLYFNHFDDGNKNYSNDIYEALRERKSKEGVHNYLMKQLHDNKKVTELYKLIKPLLADKS